MTEPSLAFLHSPSSVAVVGASDDPDKIGGRPIRYLQQFGYSGAIYPVNPSRVLVQGVLAYSDLDLLPSVPEVAVIALPGQAAVDAVERCAALGVRGCVIFASGFGEVGDPVGNEQQFQMSAAAAAAGMRLVGPNTQGLANFASGAVLGFSTMFLEETPQDGPVAIVSQSGAMCSVAYGLLRRRGVGVRYAHASGNDVDVTVGELAELVLTDPDVRLVLCYIENIRDPEHLEQAAAVAARRDVPVVALMGGRSSDGQRAAASHTGALANEHRVVDAFFERVGIWRARSTAELVATTELYLRGGTPTGRQLAVVSNSGAACVLAADAAADHGLPMATLSPDTLEILDAALPPFASKTNPVDITAALLTDSSLVGKVLTPMAVDPGVDACMLAIPVSGRGYDYARFAAHAAEFTSGASKPLVVTTPQARVAEAFVSAGCVVFEEESSAIAALSQFLVHSEQRSAAGRRRGRLSRRRPLASTVNFDEATSLDLLAGLGLPVVPHQVCPDPSAAVAAFEHFGRVAVVVKGCTSGVTHKSELGLVHLALTEPEAVAAAAAACFDRMTLAGLSASGVVVAPMMRGREMFLGAHLDPVFGPVVLLGMGGKYVESMPDVVLLLPPFDEDEVIRSVRRLNCAPLLAGVRNEPPATVTVWARAAVRLGEAMVAPEAQLRSVDANPFLVPPLGHEETGAIVDAIVQIGRPEVRPDRVRKCRPG
ncbi:MAG: acetate--CoA ligase family protein [Acidimicrobiales bacterium]